MKWLHQKASITQMTDLMSKARPAKANVRLAQELSLSMILLIKGMQSLTHNWEEIRGTPRNRTGREPRGMLKVSNQ